MPGNDVGDRVHNFFDQGRLSQDQQHTQFVATNWPGYNNNNVWNASERQMGGSVNTGPEHYNSQQSDIERGQGNQFSLGPNGLNFAQTNLRPEFIKSQQLPQLNLNGFMHASQVGQMRQNEANFLGVDTEPDRRNITSRSPSGSQLMNSASFGGSESPMNFNFFGGQHQMNGQQAGMMPSLPRQQPGSNDAQFQQQFILKQMELQRQQHQIQQFEALQRSAAGHISPSPNQTARQHQSPMNGNLLRDTSNYSWPSQITASNMNWQQRGASSSMPGDSNGFMISQEQGQAMQFMGLIPQQTSQSLYGVPVSSSRSSNAFSHSNIDKPGMLQASAPTNLFSGNQYSTLVEQAGMKEGNMVSRYGSEGNNSFGQASGQRLGNMVNLGGFTQVQQRNAQMSEGSGQGFAGGTELVTEKPATQSSSQGASAQAAVGLDPTEEKILFGSDDNIWEAFGEGPLKGSGDATDLLNGFPSMQNGTWSALMQSAVGETSSTDGGVQEEWNGLGSQNSRSETGSQHPSVFSSNEKSQQKMFESSQRASLGSLLGSNDVNVHNANTNSNSNANYVKSHEKRVDENSKSSRDFSRTDSGIWGHQQSFIGSVPANGGTASSNQDNLFDKDREMQMGMDTGRNAGQPGLSNMKFSLESAQNLPDNHQHLDLWKSLDSSGKTGFEVADRDQHNLNKGLSILESSNNTDGGAAEIEPANGDRRESASDSHHIRFPPNASVGNFRENMWSDSSDRNSLPGGKEKLSGQAVNRGPMSRNFQYHPMGDVDVNLDSSYAAKQVLPSQSMSQNHSAGGQGQEANPNFLGQFSTNIRDMEGRASNSHGPVNVSRGVSPGGAHPGYFPNMSAAFVRSGEVSSPNQPMSPSQNMLELLHKVDQSKERNAASRLGSSEYNRWPDSPIGGVAGPSQTHLSTSHGFSLQLAPPSQGIALSNLGEAIQSSSITMSSPSTGPVASEKGDKSHSWLASVSSAPCLPPSHQPTQMDTGIEPGRSGNMDADVSVPNLKDDPSISSLPQSEQSTAPGGQIIGDQSANVVFDRKSEQGHHDQQLNDYQLQAVSNSRGNLMAGRNMNQSGMRAMMSQMPPTSFQGVMAGMSRKDSLSHLGNLWASQQHLLGSQASNASELLRSQFQAPNVSKPSFTQQKRDEQDGPKRVDALSSQGIVGVEETQTAEPRSSVKVAGTSQEEPSVRHQSEASPSCSAILQKDTESFHHLANQSNASHNYYLLHQMQTMKNVGSDPSHHESKRLKGEDDGLKQIAGEVAAPITSGMDSMARDPSMSQTSVSAGDAKILNFSPQLGNQKTFQFPPGHVRTDHTGVSPQMAPSWFEQYGTFKNGQMHPMHNVPRVPVKTVEPQVISGNPPNNLVVHNSVQLAAGSTETGQIANTCQMANAYEALASAPNSASMRPKKRKTATSDLLPWNKEIGQCLKRLQNLSSAEVNWAQSSNRLIEKVEEEFDSNEDLLSGTRPRRRLLLTTQLVQQVFQPPSAAILSLDASSNYEVIVYSLARSVLGEACSLTCGVDSNSPVESANLLSGKVKTSERIQDQYFSKVVEDFVNREKELENELLRLDKRASTLDFRLECQDLERFAVINRFARFHGRGQGDGAETSSSSDSNSTALKPAPQRYVSAHPMPRNVPERVQCLSL